MAVVLYGFIALAQYAPRPLLRALLGRRYKRTSKVNLDEYDAPRREFLERMRTNPPALRDFLIEGDLPGVSGHHILDGVVRYGPIREAKRRLQSELVASVLAYSPRSVLEVGCGSGRNLLAIKDSAPDTHCLGIELSPASVELARYASSLYGLQILVEQRDAARDPFPLADVVFSVQTMENITDFAPVVDKMVTAKRAVVMLEPVIELLGWSPLEFAARIRAHHLDRLRGFWPYMQRYGATARLLPNAANAVNRCSMIIIEMAPP